MGAAGACQKCSIENVNTQIEKKKISLFNVGLVDGNDRMRSQHIPLPLSLSGNEVTWLQQERIDATKQTDANRETTAFKFVSLTIYLLSGFLWRSHIHRLIICPGSKLQSRVWPIVSVFPESTRDKGDSYRNSFQTDNKRADVPLLFLTFPQPFPGSTAMIQ